jgi:glycosyltransferase involved in cell wall biosynthesis
MIASFLACVPCKLHTVAGLPLMESYGIKRKILEIVEKLTYMLADKVYPNSFGLKEFIIKNKFCKKNKLTVIGYGSSNGIDTNYFSMNDDIVKRAEKLKIELGIKDHDFVFCFIGRVVKDKGINELLYSFNEINRNNKNTKLLLIGPFEEDLDPISNTSIEILNSNKNIIHCGWQDDIRQYLAASNALVFPSYREGFPNVPMQAGAMGLPCIVSNINGCNEIIENGKNGLIVEPKNQNELIIAMLKLMNDNDLRLYLASNARDLIRSRYEQTYVWDEILKEYQKLETEYLK